MRWLPVSWLSVLFAVALQSGSVAAATELELDENESIIVELRLGSYTLTGATTVYHSNDRTLISFQEFLDALGFAITVDSETHQASGWFIHPDNIFSLNIKNGEAYIRGQRQPLDPKFLYASDEFDLYLDIENLEQWFGLDIQLQMARLIMQITSDSPLPIEQRVMREKMRDKNTSKRGKTSPQPWVRDHYSWLGPPSMDVRLNAIQYEHDQNALWGFSLQSTGDLLKHQTRVSHVQPDQNTAAITRLTFSKHALQPGTSLGPGLTRYELGDIYVRGDSLVSLGSPGVGFTAERYLSSVLDQSFNRRDFEGDAPPGWEIELYRNGLLIDYQVVDDSGRYIFPDVEVQYGENFFEITRYGPQGQVEVERKRVQIGEQMITPKEWQFSASVLNERDQLIGEAPLLHSEAGDEDMEQSVNATAIYGLGERHSLGVGFNRIPSQSDDVENDFARLIWISAYPLLSSRVDVASDIDAGQAVSINLSGRLLKQDINSESIYFRDFESAQSNYGLIEQKHKISLFGNIPAFRVRQLPYSFSVNMIETVDGTRRLAVENRVSLFLTRNRFSNELVLSTDNREDTSATTRGVFSFGRSTGGFQFRTSLGYSLDPDLLTSGSVTMDFRRADWHAQLGAAASKADRQNEVYNLGLNLSKSFGNFAVGLVSVTDFEKSTSVAVTFDFGLKGRTHRPFLTTARYGSSDMGALEARVFLDSNGNGIFDREESPISDVKFKGRSSWQSRSTDEAGVVVLDGLDTSLGSVVTLDTLSLNDPYLRPSLTSFRVASHPGAFRAIDIPVTEVTEVEGYVYLVKGGNRKAVGGVTVGLFRGDAEIARATSEYDGYYLLPNVPPGEYFVSLIDESGAMDNYRWNSSTTFRTDVENGVTKLADIEVLEAESTQ